MKLLIAIIIIIITVGLGQMISPWWILLPIVALVTGGMDLKPWKGFIAGFIGVALLWGVYAIVLNTSNDGILAERIGKLFGGISPMLLILITALLGGIVGGLSGLTGSYGRKLL